MSKDPYVLVTTAYKGIFAGRLIEDNAPDSLVLGEARNCINWHNGLGFLGLASHGPDHKCKIGPAAPRLTLYRITSVATCTAAATEAWRNHE